MKCALRTLDTIVGVCADAEYRPIVAVRLLGGDRARTLGPERW